MKIFIGKLYKSYGYGAYDEAIYITTAENEDAAFERFYFADSRGARQNWDIQEYDPTIEPTKELYQYCG